MIGYSDLLNAQPEAFSGLAEHWDTLANNVDTYQQQWQAQVRDPLQGGGWAGAAGDAARNHVDQVHQRFSAHPAVLRRVSGTLRQSAQDIAAAKARVTQAQQQAASLGLSIDQRGSVNINPSRLSGGIGDLPVVLASAEIVGKEIDDSIRAANEADQRSAQALAQLTPQGAVVAGTHAAGAASTRDDPTTGTRAAETPPGAPAAGSDPKQVKQWWDHRSQAQKQQLADEYPDYVGQTDGIPSAARDYANRKVLDNLIGTTHDPTKLQGLTKLQASLGPAPRFPASDIPPAGDPHKPPRLLLGVDTSGSGHMIVSTGNPDSAHNVVTSVPGVNTKLDQTNVGYAVGDASYPKNVYDAALQKNPHESTAVVYWADYDAPQEPQDPLSAASSASAQHATANLSQFERGLQATHDPSAKQHSVLIGHSYGSTVVGETAKAVGGLQNLGVNDVVAVGSPGMDVNSASDLLKPPPGSTLPHVWAATSPNDEVMGPLWTAQNLTGIDAHGADPTGSGFGATVFDPGQGHHGDYMGKNDPTSLDNVGAIVAGNYNDVTKSH